MGREVFTATQTHKDNLYLILENICTFLPLDKKQKPGFIKHLDDIPNGGLKLIWWAMPWNVC